MRIHQTLALMTRSLSRRGVLAARLPALLVLAVLAVTGTTVWEAARAAHAERTTADETLRDYASFAVWALRRGAQQEVEQAFWAVLAPEHMGGGIHQRPPVPRAVDVAHELHWDTECLCHPVEWAPSALLAFTLGRDSLQVAPNLYTGPRPGIVVDEVVPGQTRLLARAEALARALPPGEGPALMAALARDARSTYREGWGLGVLVRDTREGPALVGYTLMPTAWGDTLLYAATLDAGTTRALLADVARSEDLLPGALVSRSPERVVVAASVTGPRGEPLFSTDPAPSGRWLGESRLPAFAGGLVVRAGIPAAAAGDLLIGGLPSSRLPLLVALLLLTVILTTTAAAQMRRSAQLARARSDFVASVSHELRTPLAQVRLYLETLRLGRFRTEEQRERALETVDRETARLGALVENVLYFDRATRNARRPEPVATDIGEEARAAAAAFEPLARARSMGVTVEAEPGATARVARAELRQVLGNLLDNAAKYGPEGQTIRVAVRRRDGVVEVTVSDRGPGVPPSERRTIWQPFRRGAAGADRVPGSGIGLAVAKDLVERHGGAVAVADAPGGGARFVVTLPALSAPVAEPGESGP